MLRLLIDENFNEHIVRAARQRAPALDILNVREIGLSSADDRLILQQAAELSRVVVTSDVETMVGFAYQRIAAGAHCPGLIVGPMYIRVGVAIQDLLLMASCLEPEEVDRQVRWLPLRE